MQDMVAQLEKLRADSAECRLISDLATDPKKRDLFDRLARHLEVLALEVEREIKSQAPGFAAPHPSPGSSRDSSGSSP